MPSSSFYPAILGSRFREKQGRQEEVLARNSPIGEGGDEENSH